MIQGLLNLCNNSGHKWSRHPKPGDVDTCPRCDIVRTVATDGTRTYTYPPDIDYYAMEDSNEILRRDDLMEQLTFQRSSNRAVRHLCDWTLTALCSPETRARTRAETDDDDPRDDWCFICHDIVRSFPRILLHLLGKTDWDGPPSERGGVMRLIQVMEASPPDVAVPWIVLVIDVGRVSGWQRLFVPDVYPAETWESYRLRCSLLKDENDDDDDDD